MLEKIALYKTCEFRNYAFNIIPSLRIDNLLTKYKE